MIKRHLEGATIIEVAHRQSTIAACGSGEPAAPPARPACSAPTPPGCGAAVGLPAPLQGLPPRPVLPARYGNPPCVWCWSPAALAAVVVMEAGQVVQQS